MSKRSTAVWQKLAQWYGSRMADQYGPKPPEDWSDLIDRTDEDRLHEGLLKVRRESPIHPPTLGQLEAAIPSKRHTGAGENNIAERLCMAAMHELNGQLCAHQIRGPWNYFGPVREFVSKHRGSEVISHSDIDGVQIPACEPCAKPTHRVKFNETGEGL